MSVDQGDCQNIRDYGLKNKDRLVAFFLVHARGQRVMFQYGSLRNQAKQNAIESKADVPPLS